MKSTHLGIELKIEGATAVIRRVVAVTHNTLREAGRHRIFYGLVVIAIALLLLSMLLSDLALVDQKARLVQDFGLFTIPFVGVLTAIVMGVVLLHKEIADKTIYAILPKPIRRSEFLIGKFLGLCVLLLIELTVLSLCWFVVLSFRGGQVTQPIIAALALSYVEIVLVTAIATFFSAMSSPAVSGVLTFGLFVTGRISYVITDLMNATKGVFVEVPAMRWLGSILVAVVPDLSTFNVADDVLQGWHVSHSYLLASVGYGLSYAAVFLILGLLVFERRDFT